MNTLFKTMTASNSNEDSPKHYPRERQHMAHSPDQIFIRDLELIMFIGVYPEEQKEKQRIFLSVTLDTVQNPHWEDDSIGHIISYEDIITSAEKIADEGHINLLETFVEKLAQDLLKNPKILCVNIEASKPDIFKNAQSAGVKITRSR